MWRRFTFDFIAVPLILLIGLIGWDRYSIYRLNYRLELLGEQMIHNDLDDLLAKVPDANTVRVNLINTNNYVGILDKTHSTTYTVAHVVNRGDIKAGLRSGQVLSLNVWHDYISTFAQNQCICHYLDTAPEQTQEFMVEVGTKAFIACPLLDADYHLLGALFVIWTGPPAEAINQRLQIIKHAAGKIVSYLTAQSLKDG